MITWIDNPEQLAERLFNWRTVDMVAMDTEFVRERTYYPQLALVQLAIPGEVLLVDPTLPDMAAALVPLLENADISKLMHSASEDLQAFLRGCRTVPSPLFDTQVAAAMAGLGGGLSYLKLVEQVTGITLEKGETRSDWLKRPLTESQLRYAADDVLHLHAIHEHLLHRLRQLDRLHWLSEDTERAVRNARQEADDLQPHLAIRSAQGLDASSQARLRRLLRWRDAEARRADRPKSWILDNELAVTLGRRPPVNFQQFCSLLDTYPKAPRKSRRELWEQVDGALEDADLDIPLARNIEAADRQKIKQLQEAVTQVATQLDIPEGLLCSRRHLETLLEASQWPDALQGWRRAVLEPALQPFLT